MKKFIPLILAASMAACTQGGGEAANPDEPNAVETTVAGVDAGFEAVAPGKYDVIHPDGSIDELTIHPGLTWSMVFADGNAAGGTIFAQGGKNCFVTEGVEGHQCFTEGAVAEDGSMEVTAEDGSVTVVTPADRQER